MYFSPCKHRLCLPSKNINSARGGLAFAQDIFKAKASWETEVKKNSKVYPSSYTSYYEIIGRIQPGCKPCF